MKKQVGFAIVVALLLTTIAQATELTVCVKKTGAMYLIGPEYRRHACRVRGETQMTLNTVGPQGPQGDPGPQGLKGDLGEQGPAGADGTTIPCLTQVGTEAIFEGCNVNIRNGSGSTFTQNSLGNLVVGYNEETDRVNDRRGSHNLVVGPGHSYTAVAGFVAGYQNTIGSWYPSVTGGKHNTANEPWSSVTGGENNTAAGATTSVTGGYGNTASGEYASVTGGYANTASGQFSSVSGGSNRTAPGANNWAAGSFIDTH